MLFSDFSPRSEFFWRFFAGSQPGARTSESALRAQGLTHHPGEKTSRTFSLFLPVEIAQKPKTPEVGLEPTTYRLTAGRATDCAIQAFTGQSKKNPSGEQGVPEKNSGGAGYRSLCLMHAKHALYHLSYTPRQKTNAQAKLLEPRIELGTSRVLGARDNQLHHPSTTRRDVVSEWLRR